MLGQIPTVLRPIQSGRVHKRAQCLHRSAAQTLGRTCSTVDHHMLVKVDVKTMTTKRSQKADMSQYCHFTANQCQTLRMFFRNQTAGLNNGLSLSPRKLVSATITLPAKRQQGTTTSPTTLTPGGVPSQRPWCHAAINTRSTDVTH